MNIYSYISESYLWFGYQLRFLAPQLRTRLHAISFIPQRAQTVAKRTAMDPSPLKQQLSMWKARTNLPLTHPKVMLHLMITYNA